MDHGELTHYRSIQDIDPEHIGEVIGIGAQSVVREYGPPNEQKQVIKVPIYQVRTGIYSQTIGRLVGQTYESAQRELDVCAKYFEPYMVHTRIMADTNRHRFCIVQDMISMQELKPEDAKQPEIHEQLGDIMARNRQMIRDEGKWLDAMGFAFRKAVAFALQGKPYLENVGLDKEGKKLWLFDYGLFPTPRNSLLPPYYHALLLAQRANMLKFGHAFVDSDVSRVGK